MGGGKGAGPPFLGHDVGFLTVSPKLVPLLDPPPFWACRPKMDPPPLFKNPVSAPVFSSLYHPVAWLEGHVTRAPIRSGGGGQVSNIFYLYICVFIVMLATLLDLQFYPKSGQTTNRYRETRFQRPSYHVETNRKGPN